MDEFTTIVDAADLAACVNFFKGWSEDERQEFSSHVIKQYDAIICRLNVDTHRILGTHCNFRTRLPY
jgi:hypothetical protein